MGAGEVTRARDNRRRKARATRKLEAWRMVHRAARLVRSMLLFVERFGRSLRALGRAIVRAFAGVRHSLAPGADA